ncbi:MOSC domain-containing protein [Neorhizobium galegae]|uniref:Molybdenum cofactor sulphurase n=1 Tax=Neorhizobium galegae bv. officinalis TaxID=323656 RepID=A0A0T7H3X4_NEOGA|nr:MOSC domain-containing protein [Neorhizobium galegae]CDZ54231.1 Molybdenum cofactor sulphurase [Neorhizobium galegae bv. officinalis]
MKLLAVCLGRPERLPGKSFKTGIYKSAINAAVMIDSLGLVGDAVCNTKHHGGEDQAILLEGSLTLDWWADALGRDFPPGTFGENLTVEGLDNRDVAVGDRFHIGEVVIEATCARSPCNTLAVKMGDPKFLKIYTKAARPGIYCRVVNPGMVSPGDPVRHEPYAGDRVMIAEMLAAVGRNLPETERARFLAAPIGHRWRPTFET